jgi:hypothetical protein
MFDTRDEIRRIVRERKLPDAKDGAWWCVSCQYSDLCKANKKEDDTAPKATARPKQIYIETYNNPTINVTEKSTNKSTVQM